jgi:hypothetical protein
VLRFCSVAGIETEFIITRVLGLISFRSGVKRYYSIFLRHRRVFFLFIFSGAQRICKAIGMSMAWTIASIQIAFASSMNGGLMLARSAYKGLLKRNIRLGGLIVDNHEDTSIDEYASYCFAAVGLLFQLWSGLEPPFPLNLILWPFQMGEWFVRVSVMSASGK